MTVWDTTTAQPVRTIAVHGDKVLGAALLPRRHLLATGSTDRMVRVWDITTGAQVAAVEHPAQVLRVAFVDEGRTLMAASRDGTVTLWDTVGRSPRAVIRTGTNITDAAVSADGALVAVGNAGGEITVWSTRPRARLGTLTGHTGPVDALAFSPDGRLLASGSQDRTVVLWEVAERRRWATLVGHESSVTVAAWSPTGAVPLHRQRRQDRDPVDGAAARRAERHLPHAHDQLPGRTGLWMMRRQHRTGLWMMRRQHRTGLAGQTWAVVPGVGTASRKVRFGLTAHDSAPHTPVSVRARPWWVRERFPFHCRMSTHGGRLCPPALRWGVSGVVSHT